ncbi:hypothetical protein BG261_00200 [Floricoccus tropicus]|uniref:DUF2975 domain-containing protein n=1 Tax=Floricoccus tropicus TaxID=1859473 RepID=A0A1E8GRU8_9LACT|nr:DUF2975 domain-containing protein [Floricoccus tropicus]OFI50343.1 hypothetical protein BG261_00200 [Floricoccus tropicus]
MKDKTLFKILKWCFYIGAIFLSIGIIGLLVLGLMGTKFTLFDVTNLPAGLTITSEGVINIWTILATILVIMMVIGLFWNVANLFKNLENDKIFVKENTDILRTVANCLFVLAIISKLPEFIAGAMNNSYNFNFDFSYLIMGLVVWAAMKVMERANLIAEENEFTV